MTVDLVSGGVSTVHVSSDAALDRSAVRAAVDEAGYRLADVGRGRQAARRRASPHEFCPGAADDPPSDRRPGATDSVELTIGGMTCASCAARIERKLNRMDGVVASVNYATEKAERELPRSIVAERPDRHRRGHRLHGRTAGPPTPQPDHSDPHAAEVGVLSTSVDRGGDPRHPGDRSSGWSRPGSSPAGSGLSLVAGHTGGHLVCLAVPPGHLRQPAARRHHHGHAGLAGRARGLRLVALRPVPR